MRGNVKKIKRELICIIAIVVCFLIGSYLSKSVNDGEGTVKYTATFLDVFDTKTEIIGYAPSEKVFKEQVNQLREKMIFYHQLYDIYNDYEGIKNIKTINDNAGIVPVEVDREIIELLKLSKELYNVTEGKVNVAMGSVLSIWHNYREDGLADPANAKIPLMEELKEAAKYMDISRIIIDEEASTVYIPDKEMSIDIGGIGKGYAVQKVVEYAKEIGMENVLISVGGNIAAIDSASDDEAWRFGIQNPFLDEENPLIVKVDISNLCLVTSGDYQRYYVVDGKEYNHIINPDSLMPADFFKSVTIIINDSGKADALSTALFTMPFEEGLALIDSIEGAEAMWVFEDGTIKYSNNFEQFLAE